MTGNIGGVQLDVLADQFGSVERLAASGEDHVRAWEAVFRAKPEVMHAILADYIKHRYAVPGVVGQRPMPREADVDIEELLRGPDINMLPLVEILPDLIPMGKTKFARKVCMTPTQFNSLLAGRYNPTLHELRLIADAVDKHPGYFIEYRRLLVMKAMEHLLVVQPNIATSLYKKFVQTHPGGG